MRVSIWNIRYHSINVVLSPSLSLTPDSLRQILASMIWNGGIRNFGGTWHPPAILPSHLSGDQISMSRFRAVSGIAEEDRKMRHHEVPANNVDNVLCWLRDIQCPGYPTMSHESRAGHMTQLVEFMARLDHQRMVGGDHDRSGSSFLRYSYVFQPVEPVFLTSVVTPNSHLCCLFLASFCGVLGVLLDR